MTKFVPAIAAVRMYRHVLGAMAKGALGQHQELLPPGVILYVVKNAVLMRSAEHWGAGLTVRCRIGLGSIQMRMGFCK